MIQLMKYTDPQRHTHTFSNMYYLQTTLHSPETDGVIFVNVPINAECNIGALHTGTENRLSGSGSPIRIQCGHVWSPYGTQTMRIALLDGISRTVTQHSTQLGSGSRPCGGKLVFESESRSASDADPRSRVESPIIRQLSIIVSIGCMHTDSRLMLYSFLRTH